VRFPDVPGLRPTPDRVRETLFNWLAPWLTGANCLDLFAGSGALGWEALSRGANSVVMLDTNPRVIATLSANADVLGAGTALQLRRADALSYLLGPARAFDMVFVDPPFQSGLQERTCRLLEQGSWLADPAMVYVETARGQKWRPPARWRLHRTQRAGAVEYNLFMVGAQPVSV